MDEQFLCNITRMDHEAFRQIMNKYSSDVWHYAFVLTGSRDLADDITQDVFLKVHQKIGSFRGASSFKTWIFTITRRVAADYRRTAFFRRTVLAAAPEPNDFSPSAEEEAIHAMEAAAFWGKVMQLSRKYREVLILDGKYDCNIKEIAELLEVAEGTVKSRLWRARAKMAALLNEERKELSAYE